MFPSFRHAVPHHAPLTKEHSFNFIGVGITMQEDNTVLKYADAETHVI